MRTPIPSKACLRAALFVCCVVVLATPSAAERLPIKIFTSADGLGSSFVSSLMRDSRGFLWACTRDGLSRFDGSRFVTYQIGDNGAPPGIEQILETHKGVYWISTTGGLFRFDPDAPLTASESKSADRAILKAEFISNERGALYEDHAGNLWLGSNNLYRLLEKDNKTVFEKLELSLPVNPSNSFGILAITEGPDGSLWLATSYGVVRRFMDSKQVYYRIDDPRTNGLTSILQDRNGRIWVGRERGGVVIKPESLDELSLREPLTIRNLDKLAREGTDKEHLNSPEKPGEILKYSDAEGVVRSYVRFLGETADGHIWISTFKDVIDFDGHTFHGYTSAQGLLEATTHLIEDAGENLWLGGANGLVRLDRGGLTSYLSADGLSNANVTVTNETRDKQIYVMTSDLSLSLFDGKRFQTIRPALPEHAQAIWTANAAFQDSAGEWWFLTNEKLFRFAATKDFRELARLRPRATYDSRDGLKSDQMFHLWEDSHGDLWVSTRGSQPSQAGLSRWSRTTENFYTFMEADGFPSNKWASSFAEDGNGNLWFGFYLGGLVRYAGGRFMEFTSSDGAPGGLITALHLDQQGRLWVGSSQSGLSRIDDPSAAHPLFTNFSAENGLASNNVRSITEDLFGNIYAGTARGIDRLSPDTIRIKHYSVSDGLAGDFVSTSVRDRSGALWFGTQSGLSRLVPRQDKSLTPPPVWVSGLRIAGERRPVAELGTADIPVSELEHSQNNLQIDFFGIDFSTGESLRYQYKLEGADKDWSAPTEQRTVAFANLQPGRYRFLVRAVNTEGLASDKPAIVSFRILAPIWLRWWFISLAVLLTGALFFLLYRYRVARLREVNVALAEAKQAEENLRKANEARLVELERVRKRIATDLHDDIGSSLTRISLLSEVTQRQGRQVETAAGGSLSVIAGLSRELVDSMSDIVWAINPEKDSLGDLTQRMRHFASDVFTARGIDFHFRFPESEREVRVGANLRRELFLIFKEAINNAVRHSECTESEIEFRLAPDCVFLELRDNGRGFDVQSQSRGHGLMSMRARAEGLGGKLEIVSLQGSGTTLTFV
ncbi:MAG TPA: two-component regulator propeller domain-containing protein, partial [Pyrinomonadaceae bacterium]